MECVRDAGIDVTNEYNYKYLVEAEVVRNAEAKRLNMTWAVRFTNDVIVRIVKHSEVAYRGAGSCNFFLILEQTSAKENEFKRIGIADCDYGDAKHDTMEYGQAK
jgi:hypothetical protein